MGARMLFAVVAAGCGRLAFDPVGGGAVDEDNIVDRPILAAGDQFSCARRGDGSVWCWGDGGYAALGNGVELPRTTPERVPTLPPAIAIHGGLHHVCAITETRDVWCWGDNSYGQVDGSSGENKKLPTRVPLLGPARTVVGGAYHTCALLEDGSVACWGKNGSGQIGKGPISGDHVLQHDVLDRVTGLAAGYFHTCAIRDGIVWCWGYNDDGQLGTGDQQSRETPTELPGTAATSLTAGAYYTCAINAGRFRCWGYNNDGQLGSDEMPTTPSALDGFVALRAGAYHACGLRDDGSLWCWGVNSVGTLGDGMATGAYLRSPEPRQIVTGRVDVATGWDHTCSVDLAGEVTCWGANRRGAVGDPTRTAKLRPQDVMLPGVPTKLAAGRRSACAIVGASEDMYCWGLNDQGQLAMPPGPAILAPTFTGTSNVTGLALGANFGCGSVGGSLMCWGANDAGQLGDGTTNGRYTPMPVAMNLVGVATGGAFSCATGGNDVYCWGANNYGQLGTVGSGQLTPTLAGVMASNVDAGTEHGCGLETGVATCWGLNNHGQLGRGTVSDSELPGVVAGVADFVTLSAGAEHSCGSTAAGALYCWGINYAGSLGVGDGDGRMTPALVVATGGRELTARGHHTCAEIDGVAKCWGDNVYGQIGDGTVDNVYAPKPVPDLPPGVAAFALGDEFSCVLSSDDKIRCWGDNTYGQLGIGVPGFAASPFKVSVP